MGAELLYAVVSDELEDDLAGLDHEQMRDPPDPVVGGDAGVLVNAQAPDPGPAAKLLGQADEAARRVPDPEAQKTAREKILAAKSKL